MRRRKSTSALPLHILTLNVGSSSVKYAVFSTPLSAMSLSAMSPVGPIRKHAAPLALLEGIIERLPDRPIHIAIDPATRERKGAASPVAPKSYAGAFQHIHSLLQANGILVSAVVHRVVHGGMISASCRITSPVLKAIHNATELAPLHNKPELKGILIARKLFHVPHLAVFDTAFHQTLPAKAYTYAIPQNIAKKFRIRRYGFHGISHAYIVQEACRILRKSPAAVKAITCHLGNGCSVAAIQNGRSVDTSMGFTPLEGLVMGTRCGDLDPAIPLILLEHHSSSPKKLDYLLNHRSGLLGVSGVSNDVRDLLSSSSPRAKLALDVFCYRLAKYIGAYAAAMNGVDVIVFTAGIGENAAALRERVMGHFSYLGIRIDRAKNKANEKIISTPASKAIVCVIPTNEALMMAREAEMLLRKK
ncbi:acetate kinase [Candidatus Woesearchaeota archaeon]|nr:acetate kinase [Candidatus Woesearchaeota archaeon]